MATQDKAPCGYPLDILIGGIDDKYRCSFCKLILRKPAQSICGHRYCRKCLEHLINNGSSVLCPPCHELDNVDTPLSMEEIFPDNATKRELGYLGTKCIQPGCDWSGLFRDYEKHIDVCPHRTETCECGAKILLSEFSDHKEHECPLRPVTCSRCNQQIMFKELEEHEAVCPKILLECTRCGMKDILRDQMVEHQATPECRLLILCPYGCENRIEEENLECHLQENMKGHHEYVQSQIRRLEERLGTCTEQLATLAQQVANSQSPTETGGRRTTADSVSERNVRAVELSDERNSPQEEANQAGVLQGLSRKVDLFENVSVVFQQEIIGMTKRVELVHTQRREDQERLEAMERKVRGLEHVLAQQEMTRTTGGPVSLVTASPEPPSYDGLLIWRITNYRSLRQQAVREERTSFYSEPFYTSRTGYKMCARIYLNGDGMGKDSHLSLFFVIMRGQYDALLKWPFRQRVTFILLDQSPRAEHLIDAFRPDPSSSSFKRPTDDMNVASGCPMFCDLRKLTETSPSQPVYVKEDVLFIKIAVDLSGL